MENATLFYILFSGFNPPGDHWGWGDNYVAMLPNRETSELPAAEKSTHRLNPKHQYVRACLASEPLRKYHFLLKSTWSSFSFIPSGFAFGLFSLHKTCDKYFLIKSCNLLFQGIFLVHLGRWWENPVQLLIIHQPPKPVGIFLSRWHTSWPDTPGYRSITHCSPLINFFSYVNSFYLWLNMEPK